MPVAAEVLDTGPLSGHLLSSQGTEKRQANSLSCSMINLVGAQVLHRYACIDAKLLQLLYELELFNLLFLLLNSYMAADSMLTHFSSAT